MNSLMSFEGNDVEVFEFREKVLFNPKHVAKCLGIKNVRDNITKMNEKQVVKLKNSEVGKADIRKLNNAGESFLTESGVYKLIFRSNKPEAEKFQDWVTDEVLPAIRKHSGYLTPEKVEEALLNPDVLINLATQLKSERDQRLQLEVKIKRDEAKVLFAERLTKSKENIHVGDFAKVLCDEGFDIGRTRMFALLRNEGFLMKNNLPYQRNITNGAFQVKQSLRLEKGIWKKDFTPVITPKGQLYLFKKLQSKFGGMNKVA